jgi:hypothetical protein
MNHDFIHADTPGTKPGQGCLLLNQLQPRREDAL